MNAHFNDWCLSNAAIDRMSRARARQYLRCIQSRSADLVPASAAAYEVKLRGTRRTGPSLARANLRLEKMDGALTVRQSSDDSAVHFDVLRAGVSTLVRTKPDGGQGEIEDTALMVERVQVNSNFSGPWRVGLVATVTVFEHCLVRLFQRCLGPVALSDTDITGCIVTFADVAHALDSNHNEMWRETFNSVLWPGQWGGAKAAVVLSFGSLRWPSGTERRTVIPRTVLAWDGLSDLQRRFAEAVAAGDITSAGRLAPPKFLSLGSRNRKQLGGSSTAGKIHLKLG